MIKPILACENPFETANAFTSAGWSLVFSQSIESGDPLVGVSLYDNTVLLGVTEGYVDEKDKQYMGCGVEIYFTVPSERIKEIHKNHQALCPTELKIQPWGDYAFEVVIGGYKFMIAAA